MAQSVALSVYQAPITSRTRSDGTLLIQGSEHRFTKILDRLRTMKCDVNLHGRHSGLEGECKAIGAHKLFLAAASKRFEKLFYPASGTISSAVHVLNDVDHNSLQKIVHFTYNNVFSVAGSEELKSLLIAAKYLFIDDLALFCSQELADRYVNPRSCIPLWLFACSNECFALKTACLSKFIDKVAEVIVCESFLQLPHTKIIKLVSYMVGQIGLGTIKTSADEVLYTAVAWFQEDQSRIGMYGVEISRLIPFDSLSRFALIKASQLAEREPTMVPILYKAMQRSLRVQESKPQNALRGMHYTG